jgi:ribosomal-protein-alanine N-acetyltransferase
MIILETDRLVLRNLELFDAPFIEKLVSDPTFINNIGDRGVKDLETAKNYITNGPQASYTKNGFGLWCVTLKSNKEAIGMCGLLKRDSLEHVDIGYAFLPAYTGLGYASEAVRATLNFGFTNLKLKKIVAIVSPHNERSIKLLEKCGLHFSNTMRMPGEDRDVNYYESNYKE